MADVSHELGTLRFVVESPLSSKVAMFNKAVSKHQESQYLNPFSQNGGLPKPTFNKGEYGKPLAGSLTEMRGQKANLHVLKEMLELCQIIDSEGYHVKDEPQMKVIPFGELFNIYTYISDKVVGILLRARKHKLIEFEGEVLFQRRDDDVPVFLLKPIKEIRQILEQKQEEIRRSVSPSPQSTSVIIDHQQRSVSASPTPTKSRSSQAESKTKIIRPIAQKPTQNGLNTVQSNPEIKVEQPRVSPAPQQELASAPPKSIVTLPTPSAESAPTVVLTPPVNESNPRIVDEKTDINNNEEAPAIVRTAQVSSNTEGAVGPTPNFT